MALDNQFGKGIGLAAGFDLGAQKPLDSRGAVNTIAERDAHITENRAYEGMLVYVAEANMTYQLVKGEEEGQLVWKEFGFNQSDFDGAFDSAIQDVDDRLKAVEEDLAQGGETEGRITQAEADIDALQGLVGNPADAESEATGLHLALDNAKEELSQAIATEKGRAEGQEAAIRQELADEATEIRGEMAAELGNYTVEGKEASGLRKEIEDAHAAIRQEIANEKLALQSEIDADVKAEKERAEGVESAIRGEMATEAARVDKKIADDIAAESALRVAEEQRIAGLVNAEAQRADTEEKRIVGLVETEKGRAEAAELKLTQDLAKEVEDRGKAVKDLSDKHEQEMEAAAEQVGKDLAALKQELQGEIDSDVAAEALLRENADKALDERVKPLEAHVAAQPGVDAEQDRRIKALEDDAPVKQAAIEAAQAAADQAQEEVDIVEGRALALEGRAEALEEDVARLDGAVDVEGSVKKQIKDAVDAINADAEALEARVKANEDDIVEMKAEEAKIREDFAAADAQVLADAKKHADDAITALVDSAPDAMNTLNELAKAINDNKGIYDAYVEEHKTAMNNLKAELQKEIDDDVKVVADELTKQKDDAQEGTLANKIKVEAARADAEEKAIRKLVADEKLALQGEIDSDIATESALRVAEEQRIEKALENEAAAIRGEMAEQHQAMNEASEQAHQAINKAMEDEAARVNKKIADDIDAESKLRVAEEARIEGKVDAEAAKAREEEGKLSQAIDTEKSRAEGKEGELLAAINKEIEDRGTAVAGEKSRAEGQEAAIRQELADEKAALQAEIDADVKAEADRAKAEEADIRADFAAADTALHNTIKAEMAAVIQSLSASITEEGMLRIALGGIEGDEVLVIKEQEIPFVTDDEIDEIIAGLDKE